MNRYETTREMSKQRHARRNSRPVNDEGQPFEPLFPQLAPWEAYYRGLSLEQQRAFDRLSQKQRRTLVSRWAPPRVS